MYLAGPKLDPATTPGFFLANGTCIGLGGSGPTAFYTLGAEVPPTTFAEAKEATR